MKKKVFAFIAGAVILCLSAAGCGSQSTDHAAAENTASTAAAAESAAQTAMTSATEEAAVEEEELTWEEQDDAYLSGITAKDFVELPGKYKHTTVEVRKPVDPTDDEVQERISIELKNHAYTEEVDRKVKEGDIVTIDFVGTIDGEEIEGGSGTYDLEIGSDTFIDGFEDGLIGAKKDETRELKLKFPDNYSEQSLAGKDAVFTVTVNKIVKNVIPELNDDYVKGQNLTNSFGLAVSTVKDYEDYIRSNIIEEREAAYENTVLSAIITKLIEGSTFKEEFPENLVEKYYNLESRRLQYQALMRYMDLPSYMAAVYGASEDNYQDMIREMARYYTMQELILQAIADERDLNPSEEDVRKVISEYVASDSSVEKEEDVRRLIRESLRDDLMTKNVLDWLYDHCEVEEPSEDESSEGNTAQTSTTAETTEEAAAEETAAAASTPETALGNFAESASTGETAAEEAAESASAEETAAEEAAESASTGETVDMAARHDN
jgi:trigger factor